MITLNRGTLMAVASAAFLVILMGIAAAWAISAVGLSDDLAAYARAMLGQPLPLEYLRK